MRNHCRLKSLKLQLLKSTQVQLNYLVKIIKKLFKHLKIGGTLFLGHSENPQDLIHYVKRVGQNIFVKEKDLR